MLPREFFHPVSGPCLFTLELPDAFREAHQLPPHYTFRLTHKEATDKWSDTYFLGLLTGPDNEQDYTYMGIVDITTGNVRLTKASKYTPDSWPYKLATRLLQRITKGEGQAIEQAGFRVHHEGKCGRCGRTLTVPESIERGIGPECWKSCQ